MVLAPLLAAPSLLLLATAAERRFGPAVAGTVAAAPLSIAVVVVAVGADGPALAASAGAHVVAQVAFALAFAAVVIRRGGRDGLLAGAAAFVAVSLLVEHVPAALATAAAVPALAFAPRPRGGSPGSGGIGSFAGAAVVFVLVGVSLAAAAVAGPALAGTIAAFPALSGTLALLIARARGPEAAACALGGLLVGLRGYLAFCVVVAATGSVPLGLLIAVLVPVLRPRRWSAGWLRTPRSAAQRG